MSAIALAEPGVANAVSFPGLSINGFTNSASAGIVFVTLKPFDQRTSSDLSGMAIAQKLQRKYAAIQNATIAIFPPPPVQGLGSIGGFKLQVEDRTDLGDAVLSKTMQDIEAKAHADPALVGVFSNFNIGVPQLDVDLDRTKAQQLGVNVQDVFDAMQTYLGSIYVDDFNRFGRTYQVIAQADTPFRSQKDDILRLKVRNTDGQMVPLGAMVNIRETTGPDSALKYNGFRSADLNGGAAPGYSSGQAQAAITKILAQTLPKGMTFEWTDLTYQQILSGNTALLVFPLCVLLVFLVLSAQYESLFLPLAIILIVPLCLFSAIAGVWITGGDNNNLHPDRPLRADRPRLQERDPDRGVRARPRDPRHGDDRRRHRGGPPSAAPDPDDELRLHHGRDPAGAVIGRRRGDAPCDGRGGVLRHAGRDVLRPVPDAGVLCPAAHAGEAGSPARNWCTTTSDRRSAGVTCLRAAASGCQPPWPPPDEPPPTPTWTWPSTLSNQDSLLRHSPFFSFVPCGHMQAVPAGLSTIGSRQVRGVGFSVQALVRSFQVSSRSQVTQRLPFQWPAPEQEVSAGLSVGSQTSSLRTPNVLLARAPIVTGNDAGRPLKR